jgi:hypothetical protein
MEKAIIRFGLDRDFACIGKLDGIADEINQDLSQAASVAVPGWQFGGKLELERELLVSRQRFKRAADGLGYVLDGVIGQFKHELTSLDLGQVKHVIDQSKQMPAVGLATSAPRHGTRRREHA